MFIIVLIETSTGIVWYNTNVELAYLCIEMRLTVVYTILTANRLLVINQLKQIMPEYDSSAYNIVVLVVIESAVSYSVFAIIFIVSFTLHSNVSNLCLSGIAQLLIIILFSGTLFDSINVEAAPEQCDAQLHVPVVSMAESMFNARAGSNNRSNLSCSLLEAGKTQPHAEALTGILCINKQATPPQPSKPHPIPPLPTPHTLHLLPPQLKPIIIGPKR
ncbi:hypothetical protein P692DRAFT_20879672 [Suillus brevipes Sb2]|nr:hypothetical protein P692DRAFT_20879672 [Suillus brevipes Sb2]